MKRRFLSLLLLPLLIVGCNNGSKDDYKSESIEITRNTGDLSSFNLLTPENGFVTPGGFTFTWEASENADYYQLEIANYDTFFNDPADPQVVYVKESNISQPSFALSSSLPLKDITYFWRVTAVNQRHKLQCNEVNSFFYQFSGSGELPIEIENEQDWTVHKEGSQANVSIDRNNFFGNDKNSLVISFDKEHTSQGITSSDGWIVITKSEDRELYGTDAFYFNFFYSGHDATVLIRVLDYDGEYWHQQVKIANNSKQTILMKYSDFTLRTAGTNINNRRFDWEHIRYFEIVFERTFGDGVCVISDIKGVLFKSYQEMYMSKMNFDRADKAEWTYENYNFDKEIINKGNGITISFTKATGFSGYGFQNVNLYKYFADGDALRMKIKYESVSDSAVFYFRVLEEDMDRWQFKLPFKDFDKLEEVEEDTDFSYLIIPLKAFQRTDYMQGDGAKQFYFIQKFNFGLADNYKDGSITIKDLEVIQYSETTIDKRKRPVPASGCIEDFNSYGLYTEIYYQWEQSLVNKDEAMKLDSNHKLNIKNNGVRNVYCGEFDYKADMEQAVYQLYLDTTEVTDKNAFSIWLNDASVKPNDPVISYLDEDEVAAELTIQLTMSSGEWYRYTIETVKKDWYKYTILFSDFELVNGDELFDDPNPLTCDAIMHMAFGFQYFYYDQNEKAHPTYAIANPVYLDEIYFEKADKTEIKDLGGVLKPALDNPDVIYVDSFEKSFYPDEETLFDNWSYLLDKPYNLMKLSSDVSYVGGEQSLLMKYKGSDSVSYSRVSPFSRKAQGKGIAIDIKGDGKAVVYLNLNVRAGTNTYKMRYAITNIPTTWTHYEIGFDYFKDVNGSLRSISLSNAKQIETISFGIINNSNTESQIYIDNLDMIKNIDYKTLKILSIIPPVDPGE